MRKNRSGQVGLLLLVVLGLVISVVLSIAARSLSDVILTRQERENSAAFAVAEKGVEAALLAIRNGELPGTAVGIADSTGLVSGEYQALEINSFDLYVKAGEQAEINLSGYGSPTVSVNWTKKSDPSENVGCGGEGAGNSSASLELIAVRSGSRVARSYYNAYGCSLGNNFSGSSSGSGEYLSRVSYTLPSGTELLRLRPLYTGATISVGGAGLTTQMYLVQSSATGGDAQKEIEVKRTRDSAGSVFDYALFSGESIVK